MSELVKDLKYPVPISQVMECLPHRDSAVWVDEVTWAQPDQGECRIIFKEDAHYIDNGFIRDTSFIEWMAQAYGYVCACQVLSGLATGKTKAQKAYLVGIRNFTPPLLQVAAGTGDWVRCWVRKTNELGPIELVEGKVFSSTGELIATAQLKVFSQ